VPETGPFDGESTISETGAAVMEGDDGNLLGSWARPNEIALRPITTAAA